MKIPVLTNQFKKDYKLSIKRGKDNSEIQAIMSKLANEELLPPKNKDHQLTSNYSCCRECHIEPDWLLIYELQKTKSFLCVQVNFSFINLLGTLVVVFMGINSFRFIMRLVFAKMKKGYHIFGIPFQYVDNRHNYKLMIE